MKAVLSDPAAGRVNRLRPSGDVPEQATEPAYEFVPVRLFERQPGKDRRRVVQR